MKTKYVAILAAFVLLFSGCVKPMPGSDADEHGCIGSAGYVWCEKLNGCIRPWETDCSPEPQVRILTENFPPFSFQGASGAVDGRSSEVVRLILAGMNESGTIEIMGWPEAYNLALEGPAVALYSTARSPQREGLFKWVGPIGTYDKTIYVKAGSDVSAGSLEEAKGLHSLCTVANDDRAQYLQALGFENLLLKEDDEECMAALAAGKADAWFGSKDTMPYVASWAGVPADEVEPALEVEKSEIYIAFSKDTPDAVVAKWQASLDRAKADGIFESLMEFWGSGIAPGSDIDSHGCIGSAGYLWCEPLQQCTRRWETPCPEGETPIVGNDSDEFGCKGSAGYQWCPEKSACVRVWEEGCPSLEAKALRAQAEGYCAEDAAVSICGEYIKVASSMPGAGSSFYALGNYEPIRCPVVAPDYMTPECRQLTIGNNCVEQKVC